MVTVWYVNHKGNIITLLSSVAPYNSSCQTTDNHTLSMYGNITVLNCHCHLEDYDTPTINGTGSTVHSPANYTSLYGVDSLANYSSLHAVDPLASYSSSYAVDSLASYRQLVWCGFTG